MSTSRHRAKIRRIRQENRAEFADRYFDIKVVVTAAVRLFVLFGGDIIHHKEAVMPGKPTREQMRRARRAGRKELERTGYVPYTNIDRDMKRESPAHRKELFDDRREKRARAAKAAKEKAAGWTVKPWAKLRSTPRAA